MYVSPDPQQGIYWAVLTLHFYMILYFRLRWRILNDYQLDLYKGRPGFTWTDVILELTRFSGLPIENKVQSKCNQTFYNIIPKRGMRKVAEKAMESPEVQKVVITSGVAAVAAGVAATSDLLSTPEKRAIKEKEKILKSAEEEQQKASDQLEKFPITSEIITDKAKEERGD
ncbi:hypothetical protein CLOM_g6719 [Closterium sp. NIES-68]|nr:hypothetical protein CLOM_g6719 [Closterium sp. NIES-68]